MKQNIIKYLKLKGWKATIDPTFSLSKEIWIKGVYIENTKNAYELQQKWDKEEK